MHSRRSREDSSTQPTARQQSPIVAAEHGSDDHACPWCGSADITFVKRGFIGPTDDRNQYLSCRGCNRRTYEIVSRTARDVRIGKFQVGDTWRDYTGHMKYTITRMLKVGMNEVLLYVKPADDPGSH